MKSEVSGADIVNYLMKFKGTPYVWGGNSLSKGIDCSGLLQQGFAHFGINIARVTNDQIGQGKSVAWDQMQIGDAIFFDTDPNRSGPDHVGIYIGNGKMLHAPKTGDVVKVSDITGSYYASRFMGARRFGGVAGGGDSNKDWASQTAEERRLSPEEMTTKYGLSYALMNSDPSLKKLFNEAVKGNWSTEMFQAKMKDTDWWKSNSDARRKALRMKFEDPATWQASIDAQKEHIKQMATEVGAVISDTELARLSEDSMMMAMDDERLKTTLGGYVNFVNGSLVGQAGIYEQSMRKYAEDMGVELNQQAIKNYAQLMIKGMSTEADFQNFIKDQAVSSYPAYEDQIKQGGMTIKDIANPYIQMMAETLDMNPNAIAVKDPTVMAGMNAIDQDGKPVGRTMTQFADTLRGDPRWRGTKQAQDLVMNTGQQILKDWGLM